MAGLLESVRGYIAAHNLLKRGDRILVAVSGGLDSMVLLNLLVGLQKELKWRLAIAHLNHCLRGRSSDADERLVRATAKKLRIPCFVERVEVKKLAAKEKLSLEMAARKVRHKFLAKTASKHRFKTVALAHHADDQVELFFIRLFRGSGLDALAGMLPVRTSPVDPGIRLVRPLLQQTKTALQVYAKEHKIKFREDASNASIDILRNRIRHKLLPLLTRDYQPTLQSAVLRTMELARGESEFASQSAKQWLEASKLKRTEPTPFRTLAVALQRHIILQQLHALSVTPDFHLVERLRLNPRTLLNAPGLNCQLTLDASGILVQHKAPATEFQTDRIQLRVCQSEQHQSFGGLSLNWKHVRARSFGRVPRRPNSERFDAARIGEHIVLRHWQPGDRFQPIGMKAPVKLQDLFVNAKVHREHRCKVVLATTAAGEIFWVEGLRISEKFKLTPATKRELHWTWREVRLRTAS